MAGQAEMAPSLDDVAELLFDNPEADSRIEPGEAPPTPERAPVRRADKAGPDAEENPDDESGDHPDENADPDADPDEGEDDEEGDETASQTSGLKFKVPVKAEDGTDTTVEVDEKELIASYLRHSDYTKKTQQLAERETQAFQVVNTRLEEGRQHYLQEAQKAHQAIVMLAGLKTPQELAVLAQTDPSAWVAENARTQAIQGVLAQIESGIRSEVNDGPAAQQQKAAAQADFQRAWGVLGQEGIDKPKLQAIFEGVHEAYGVPKEKFAQVSDPKLVLLMRDALKFRELDKKAAGIKKQVAKAPPVPAARQSIPQETRAIKQVTSRIRSGKGSMHDLGRFLELNG